MKNLYEIPDLVWVDQTPFMTALTCHCIGYSFTILYTAHSGFTMSYYRNGERRSQEIFDTIEAAKSECNRINRELLEKMLVKVDSFIEGNRVVVLPSRPAAPPPRSECDCGKIEHGRHHIACPAFRPAQPTPPPPPPPAD